MEKNNSNETERINPAPAFQLYPKDFLSDSTFMALSNEERGLLFTMILLSWLEEFLPKNEKKLAKILKISAKKFQKLFAAIEKFFKIEGDFIICPMLDEIRQKQANWRAKSSIGGQKSAEVRRKGGLNLVDRVVEPPFEPKANIASSSSFAFPSSEGSLPAKAVRSLSNVSETEKFDVVGSDARAREAKEIFDFWKTTFGSKREFNKHYRRTIEAKFSEGFTADDLKSAIHGYKTANPPESHNVRHHGNFPTIMRDIATWRTFNTAEQSQNP